MFNLEKSIEEWRKGLRKNEALEDGSIAELESHLRDGIEKQLEEGKSEEDAFDNSVKNFGDNNVIGGEYHKTKSRRINKKPPWQESIWGSSMFAHYIKVAKRSLLRNKGFSFINITGLTLGLACCILIALWILDEFSYDSFHKNYDKIYGVVADVNFSGKKIKFDATSPLLGPALKEEFPEVMAATRYQSSSGEILLKYEDKVFYEKGLAYVDPSFLEIFDFSLIYGDKSQALADPNSIIISETLAKKYFGNDVPIGKTLVLNNENICTVTGVMKKIPHNSSIQFEMLAPFIKYYTALEKEGNSNNWSCLILSTYVQLKNAGLEADVKNKLTVFVKNKLNSIDYNEYSLVPAKEFHFSPYYGEGKRMTYIYIFAAIAFFILLIACINFMNLSTVSAAGRAKEIGIRKVVGATKKNTALQFLGEFFFLSVLSLLLSLVIVVLCLPLFNSLFDKELELNILGRWYSLLTIAGITIFAGIIGGSYPALVISSFKPSLLFKQNISLRVKKLSLRKILVVFQFILSIVLIVVMWITYSQINFIKNKDLGFDKSQTLFIELKSSAINNYGVLKNSLTGMPGIVNITGAYQLPTNMGLAVRDILWPGKDRNNIVRNCIGVVDFDFCKTMKIDLLEGKEYSIGTASEDENGVIINEELAKLLNNKIVLGQTLNIGILGQKNIIGVVKNFHYRPLDQKILPLALALSIKSNSERYKLKYLILRIEPGNIAPSIALIKKKWSGINPSLPFEFQFLNDRFNAAYRSEERFGNIIGGFAIIAIFISGLGLFGLASFTAAKRRKEIAIRKVLGSSAGSIIKLLFKEYLYLALIANIIAWPIGFYIADKWLEEYVYKTNIDFMVFAIAGLLAIIIVIISVGYQSITAAYANPVKNIKCE